MKTPKSKKKDLFEVADEFVKSNPEIKKSLKIFNISQRQYVDALNAMSYDYEAVKTTTKTTIQHHVELARD